MSFVSQQPVNYTPSSTVGGLFIDAMEPWLTLPLAWLLDSAGSMFDEVYGLVTDQGFDGDPDYVPGYGTLLNPQTCPDEDLGYLAQFVGARIPPGTPPAQARQIIISEPGQKRGSVPSIISAAQRFLIGTQSVSLLERIYVDGTPNPDWFVLVVRPEELVANYVPDPSFEHDTVGSAPVASTSGGNWFVVAGATPTVVLDPTTAFGSKVCRVVTTNAAAGQGYGQSCGNLPMNTYTASVWVRGAAGGEALKLTAGPNIGGGYDSTLNFTATTSWQQVSTTFTTDGSHTTSVNVQTTSAAAVTVYVDAFQITVGSTVLPFVSGDIGGASWSGTAGNSSSTYLPALVNAVNAIKPGGLMWSLLQTDGWTISQMESAYTSITALEAAFPTLTALEADQI